MATTEECLFTWVLKHADFCRSYFHELVFGNVFYCYVQIHLQGWGQLDCVVTSRCSHIRQLYLQTVLTQGTATERQISIHLSNLFCLAHIDWEISRTLVHTNNHVLEHFILRFDEEQSSVLSSSDSKGVGGSFFECQQRTLLSLTDRTN